jgi:dienelactone hydrolase
MHKSMLIVLLFLAIVPIARAEVVGKEVSYQAKGLTMKGYLAYDDKIKGRRPAVLVVHEWWGLNDYARMLAELGYTAFAVDMYGDGKQVSHPDDAGKFAGEVRKNRDAARARFEAAMNLVKKQKTVDPHKIAAIGYCFGGSVVLDMARQGEPLAAVASFHGGLGTDTPAQPGKVKAPIMVFTGADDPMAPPKDVDAFKAEMDKAGAHYQVVSYPGVKHSFTNPDADEYAKKFNLPLAYNAEADKSSWADTEKFLVGAFAGKK